MISMAGYEDQRPIFAVLIEAPAKFCQIFLVCIGDVKLIGFEIDKASVNDIAGFLFVLKNKFFLLLWR